MLKFCHSLICRDLDELPDKMKREREERQIEFGKVDELGDVKLQSNKCQNCILAEDFTGEQTRLPGRDTTWDLVLELQVLQRLVSC